MKVRLTVEMSDEDRRALNASHGLPGLATLDDVRSAVRLGLKEMISSLAEEQELEKEREQEDDPRSTNEFSGGPTR